MDEGKCVILHCFLVVRAKFFFMEIRNISISGFCIENIRNKRKAALSELERVFNVTIQDRP